MLAIDSWGKVHLIWQGGDEDIEGGGGLRKFLDTERGSSEKIIGAGYFKTQQEGQGNS